VSNHVASSARHTAREQTVAAPSWTAASRLRNGLIFALLMTVVVAGAIAALPGLGAVKTRVDAGSPGWLCLAVLLELLSCLSFVVTFRVVFFRAPRQLAQKIAWSEMAFGMLVPLGGAGGVALGAWVLHAKGAPLGRVTRRSAVLFLLTSAVNGIVLVSAGLVLGSGLTAGPHPLTLGLLPAVLAAAALALGSALPLVRRGRVTGAIADAVRDTWDLVRAGDPKLAAAFGYLLFDIAVLWTCLRAFGCSPAVAPLVLGYQIGYLANLVPVPGGLAVLDGGLTGALALYGLPLAPAAAAVLVYHAIALWLPTILGSVAFARLRRTLGEPLSPAVYAAQGNAT
jgi:uncharacterized membrane protein YbhN (UPF0104 family)